MPTTNDDRVELLAKRCDTDLGDPDLWFRPDGYPHSLALCIIDSIASTGAHYNSVKNILRHYIEYRIAQGGDADTDNAGDLLGTFGELGSPQEWAAMTNNRKPTSTAKGAPLKAAAIYEAADRLRETWNRQYRRPPRHHPRRTRGYEESLDHSAGAAVRDHVELLPDARRHPRCES